MDDTRLNRRSYTREEKLKWYWINEAIPFCIEAYILYGYVCS